MFLCLGLDGIDNELKKKTVVTTESERVERIAEMEREILEERLQKSDTRETNSDVFRQKTFPFYKVKICKLRKICSSDFAKTKLQHSTC